MGEMGNEYKIPVGNPEGRPADGLVIKSDYFWTR
jgi:hypothetical protein